MTNDLVASQQQSKDMDQGNRKRVAPKEELEEELTKKRLRDNASEHTAEAAEGKPSHGGQRAQDVEELDGSRQENIAEQGERPVDNNDAAISEGADVVDASDTVCVPVEHQKQEEEPALAPEEVAAPEPGTAADASGPPGPPPEPIKQYTDVKEALISRIEAALLKTASPAWSGFTDYIGEGIRTRLLAVATLHLTESGAARCPDAVRQLDANSNRILLGAAPNCQLYQERVIRALAHQVGARLLVADSAALHFDDLPPSSKSDPSEAELAAYGGGSGLVMNAGGSGGIYDTSEDEMPGLRDDDDPFLKPPPRKHATNDKSKEKGAMLDKKTQDLIKRAEEAVIKSQAGMKKLINASLAELGKDLAKVTEELVNGEKQDNDEDDGSKEEEKEEEKEKVETEKDNAAAEEIKSDKKEEKKPDDAGPSSDPTPLEIDEEDAAKDVEHIERLKAIVQQQQEEVEEQKALEEELEKARLKEENDRRLQFLNNAIQHRGMVARRGRPASMKAKIVARVGRPRPEGMQSVPESVLRDAQRIINEAKKNEAKRERNGSGGEGEGKASGMFQQGDRVCYSTSGPPSLSLFSSEDRERASASKNALSAYLSMSWVERREALKRKQHQHDAAGTAGGRAASLAADAAPTEDDKNPHEYSFGRVLSISGDDTVNVVMDDPFSAGKSFPNQPDKCGFTCSTSDLSPVDDRDDAIDASFRALFNTITDVLNEKDTTPTAPLIIFLPNVDRMIRGNDAALFRRLKERLSSLPARCLFIGGYCSRSLAKEKASSGPSGLSMLFGGGGPGGRGGGGGGGGSDPLGIGSGDDLPMPWYERFGGGEGGGSGRMARSRAHHKGRAFAAMFPNTVELHPPHADGAAKAWKKMLDQDIAAVREKANRVSLIKALRKCDVVCEDMEAVKITELTLGRREVEQVVGAAVANALIEGALAINENEARPVEEEVLEDASPIEEAVIVGAVTEEAAAAAEKIANEDILPNTTTTEVIDTKKQLIIKAIHLTAAAATIQHLRAEAAPVPERSALKDLNTDQYERQLLSEVVPPEEIAVGFNDIGALDAVKTTLHEVVILPLQRPELFTRGALTRPTKGLLLFGPPGTGKTMLAKAVASESGAHFININMSAITSKWLGEGERLVRAVFSLAHKLAPSVIFIDEIDSFLSRRGGSSGEHEALRKMKTEFLAGWDGLRTKQTDRVLVLAATNRPMDLDDAAIRRMPRRIFVPLPDASQREKILRTILKDEEVDQKLDFADLGRDTDGYSGSDLKNLCIAAAYCPLRELLEVEKQRLSTATDSKDGVSGGVASSFELPPVRSINMSDFVAAMKQVTPSTHADSASMSDLQKWNEQYGEGGSRRAEPLVYYT